MSVRERKGERRRDEPTSNCPNPNSNTTPPTLALPNLNAFATHFITYCTELPMITPTIPSEICLDQTATSMSKGSRPRADATRKEIQSE